MTRTLFHLALDYLNKTDIHNFNQKFQCKNGTHYCFWSLRVWVSPKLYFNSDFLLLYLSRVLLWILARLWIRCPHKVFPYWHGRSDWSVSGCPCWSTGCRLGGYFHSTKIDREEVCLKRWSAKPTRNDSTADCNARHNVSFNFWFDLILGFLLIDTN